MDKSSLGLFGKKNKVNNVAKTLKKRDEKAAEGSCFWKKFVRFLRGGSSGREGLPGDKKSADQAFGKSDDASENSIEIPIECREDISKILIIPTKSGLKITVEMLTSSRDSDEGRFLGGAQGAVEGFQATLSQHPRLPSRPKPSANAAEERARPAAGDANSWTEAFEKNETQLEDERERERGKRLKWKRKMPEEEEKLGKGSRGTLLTSAFIIRRNAEETLKNGLSLDPNLPNDCGGSRISENGSQTAVKMKKTVTDYRVVEERNERILKVLKTTSEPAWSERTKLIQKQQLHDNINNLLEQFVYLEAENIFDFTLSRSQLVESETNIQFNKNSALGLEELSREVSPEILVNVKPFKEYICEGYFPSNAPSATLLIQNQMHGLGMRNDSDANRPRRRMNARRKRGKERRTCEILKTRSALSKGVEFEDASGEIAEFPWFRAMRESGDGSSYEEYQEEVSLRLRYGVLPEEPGCTVWGVYKAYSAGNEKTDETREWSERKGSERGKKKFPSIDELLDDLDDEDHDLVFRKNLSQFKKKIKLMPRFDLNNFVVKTQQKSVAGPEHSKVELEMIKCEYLGLWEQAQTQKFLEQSCAWLPLPENRSIARTLALGVEEGVVKWLKTAREVHQMKESNNRIVVEGETPENYEMNVKEVHLFGMESKVTETAALEKDQDHGGRTQAEERSRKAPISSFSENFAVRRLRPILRLGRYGHRSNDEMNLSSCRASGETDEKPKETIKEGSRDSGSQNEKLENVEKTEVAIFVSEPPSKTVETMTKSSWTNVIFTSDNKLVYRKVESNNRSESINENPLVLESAQENANELEHPMEERLNPDSSFDGFKIIYNNSKESLNDDEDDSSLKKPISVTGRWPSFVWNSEDFANRVTGNKKHPARFTYRIMEVPENPGRKWSQTLKHKSNSSPRENIVLTEFVLREHRTRRSLVFSSEAVTDVQTYKKRRLSTDMGMEIKRTGSALPYSRSPKPGTEKIIGKRGAFRSLVFSNDLKTVVGEELKSVERNNTMMVEDSEANVRSEMMAAFNSIKDLNSGKGEEREGRKRMSLVILISRK